MSEDRVRTDYKLSDQSQEFLQQIIRCFPFPSPRNSPRPQKKSIVRTISNDPSILEHREESPNPSIGKNESGPATPSFSASANTPSAWQLRKKQLGHLLQRVTSHEAPEGNLGTSSSAATLLFDSKDEKSGALGRLCKVS
jgi:hypothetical protein